MSHAEMCARLTGRERQILVLLSGGIGIKRAAHAAGTTVNTVKNQTKIIRAKLGVSNMTAAAVIATKAGLL